MMPFAGPARRIPERIARSAAVVLLATTAPAALAAQTVAPASASLAARIDRTLSRAPLDRGHWGIVVVDPRTGEDVYARNADRLFVPASNLKLIVSSAATHYLPADFRFGTAFYATGPVRGGTLEGDLVVRGNGDPTISGRYFDDDMTAVWKQVADSLRSRGVTRVAGGIVADETAFDSTFVHPEWESYDLNWWYAAPVGPIGFNDNSIDFHIAPGAVGQPATIHGLPESAYYTLINRTRTAGAGAGRTLDFTRVGDSDTILAYGTLAADARPYVEYFAVREPGRYATTVLRETLEAAGIDVAVDSIRVARAPGAAPAEGAPLFTWRSPPLPDLIFPILNTSQNWFAEEMLKTIGLEEGGEASWDAGIEQEKRFLTDVVGLDPASFELRDGSGLSAANLVTPRALARLLIHVRDDGIVQRAIPVSGESPGSLRYRLTDLKGRVRAKTGSIRNVHSLSGYVTTDSGRELVFSIIANGTAFPGAVDAIDDVVRAIAAQ